MSLTDTVPDSERCGLIGALPAALRPYASLMRVDRPIGTWLLFWPCAWGVALSGNPFETWTILIWLLVGAFAMRSAGCVYNDIVDRNLDKQVERTRLRPLASGRTSVRSAILLLAGLLLIGLAVWWRINFQAKVLALCTLPVIALYPFAKRFTWWPQFVLGLVFASGAAVGFAAANGLAIKDPSQYPGYASAMWLLYAGTVAWVIGYDSLYAIQDIEDDALVGVKSSARRMGGNVRLGVGIFYALALLGWGAAIWKVFPDPLALVAQLPAAIHLASQAWRADPADGEGALKLFRSNRWCGALVCAAMLVVGLSPGS